MDIKPSRKSYFQASPTVMAIILSILTIISRFLFQPKGIESFDAVNYILAISNFDMRLGQPQPPGYILYILVARFINQFVLNPHLALLVLSHLASGGAVFSIFMLGKEIFDEKTGFISAILLACCPFFWHTGELASPYTAELFVAILFSWLAFMTIQKKDDKKLPWITAVMCGIVGAFRLQTLVFLFPLFIFSVWKRPYWKTFFYSVVVVLVFSVFFVPSVIASGGVAQFLDSMGETVPIVSSTSQFLKSVFFLRFVFNAYTLLNYTFQIVGDTIWPFVAIGLFFFWKNGGEWRKIRILFFLFGLIPAWTVFVLIWVGNIATAQVTTTFYFIVAAYGIKKLTEVKLPALRRIAWSLLTLLVFLQISIFSLFPERPFGDRYHRLYNWDSIQRSVNNYQEKINLIKKFPSQETVIFAEEFRLPQYYIPDYLTYSIPIYGVDGINQIKKINEIRNGKLSYLKEVTMRDLLPPGTRNIIFFDLPLAKLSLHNTSFTTLGSNSSQIIIIEVQNNQKPKWYLAPVEEQ